MSEHTTRIADLPENITMQMPQQDMRSQMPQQDMRNQMQASAPTYSPMNVHPNPYGNTVQPAIMPLPEQADMGRPHRLPTRDIPMDQSAYQNDEEVQPNYIPKAKLTSDYVKDYENLTESNIRRHESEKRRQSKIDYLITTLQVPITIAFLFFIFHMPMVNTMFFKNFSFLSIYNSDGNINYNGIALKSVMFGALFYAVQNTIDYLGDI
jgi:hypothetical protein